MRHRLEHEPTTDRPPPRPPAPSAVGTVIAILDDEVVVNVDGILRRASARLVPRLRVGDWVSIGPGSVLDVIEPDDR